MANSSENREYWVKLSRYLADQIIAHLGTHSSSLDFLALGVTTNNSPATGCSK